METQIITISKEDDETVKKQDTGSMRRKEVSRLNSFIKNDLFIALLDIIAVNVSYFISIYIRFFVAGELVSNAVVYPARFWTITPFYTVAAITTFVLFRLYGGMWQYAAINDINRIIFANLTTVALQVIISVLVLAVIPQEGRQVSRMPLTYYILGAILQFILVFLIRFSYKFVHQEKERLAKSKSDMVPALVIGSDDLGIKVVHHLENNTMFHAVSIAGEDAGRMLDGIRVIPLDKIGEEIQAKGIRAVFIADKKINKEERDLIRQVAEGLELNDFTGYMSNQSGFLPLTNLLDVMESPITVQIDDVTRTFDSAEECLSALPDEYDVVRIQSTKIILKKKVQDDSWMKVYQEQTGQDVSYF